MTIRRAEEILAETYEAEGWSAIATTLRAGAGNLGDKLVTRAIVQAQREILDAALHVVAEQRCERGTPWDRALVAAMDAIRSLIPSNREEESND
jgi:hypothetical protein